MVKVLVVDDSGLMVKLISEIIQTDPELHVIGTASHGFDAVQKVETLHPDVITMDVNMPRMDGLKAVEYIMSTHPTPIVMISSLTQKGAETTIQALNLGAIDFIEKPSGYVSLDIGELAAEIITKIKLAAKIHVIRTVNRQNTHGTAVPQVPSRPKRKKVAHISIQEAIRQALFHTADLSDNHEKVVAIGCSTGGPQALNEILQHIPADFPAPILVVQHMPEKFTEKLAELLNDRIALHTLEAKEGMSIRRGIVYIAPGSYHMKVQPNRTLTLEKGHDPTVPCPSADILMKTVATTYRENAIGVILTGMGNDGKIGMNAIKDAKGVTIAQDEETSLVFGMPKAAIESGCIDSIVPLNLIADEIMNFCRTKPVKKIEKSVIR